MLSSVTALTDAIYGVDLQRSLIDYPSHLLKSQEFFDVICLNLFQILHYECRLFSYFS